MISPFCSDRMLASPSAVRSQRVCGLTWSSNASSSSSFFFVIRWSNSDSCSSTSSSICASQCSLTRVFLKSPARCSVASTDVAAPVALSRCTLLMIALPQSISVTSSPSFTSSASAWSIQICDDRIWLFLPAGGCFLWRGTVTTSSASGPPASVTETLPSHSTAVWRGHTGSMSFLFIVQILSHSWYVTFFDAPCERMNSLSTSILRPRRMMPCTVGMRGSSQPDTRLVSTNHVSLRLDRTV
mmetsp:Transcript_42977/g.129012  ORF Transcript_42977/g.129012 Transcript_42977/m.129012 type:complete len:242 (+) Transcript_42977:479-1204(+)